MQIFAYRKYIILGSILIAVLSLFFATKVQFVFDFERFFPKGDPDLDFFYAFREEFEDDDNFLLVAFTDSQSIFNSELLQKVDVFTKESSKLNSVNRSSSITNFSYFVKLQFGGFSPPYPAVNIDNPARLAKDSVRVMQDERIVGNFISKDSKATVVVIKTKNGLSQDESEALMKDLKVLLQDFDPENYHILGKAYFQVELVKQQIKEFIISTLISAFLVSLVFWWMMRKPLGVLIAIISMILCLLVFVGMIGFLQIELDLLSALFPIIMIIVGVSDVVHLSNKYVDEYEKWNDKKMALTNTIKEIGLATFLTSFTTAIGFLSLMTSKIYPVKMFGFTAAIGVMLAFVIVITFTSSFLAMLPANKIVRKDEANATWKKYLLKIYEFTKTQQRNIIIGGIVYTLICAIGIYLITTNVKIYDTLPKGMPVTKDFKFFEEKFAGFRPFELAILVKEPHKVDEWEVLQEINKIEAFIKTQEAIEGVSSVTAVYKTMNRAMNADRSSFYTFPSSEAQFKSMKRYIDKIPTKQLNVLVNADKTKARISAKIKDIGSDNIEQITQNIMNFVDTEVNKDLMKVRITGTGVIFDKNNEYIRQSLLSGLLLAFVVISLTMALLFRDWRMLIISIIPNVFPLLFGGAIMGFFQIALDAPTAIIFAISFGIAVDDTIHFLSKFKIERAKNKGIEEAIETTFLETGKSIILTSIILFFGFLILLFSKTPGIVFVGILVSGTLLTAVIADLLLLPILIRKFLKE